MALRSLGTVLDITEMKQAEESLERSLKINAIAEKVAQTGSWEWELESNTVTYSDNALRLYGLDPGSYDGSFETAISPIHADDREEVQKRIEEMIAAKRSDHFEYRAVKPDGSIRVIEATNQMDLDDSGNVTRLVGMIRDVTEQKKVLQALEDSEEKYRSLVEDLPIGVAITTPEGATVEANPAIIALLGYDSREELLGIPVTDHYATPADRERLLEALREGPLRDFEVQLKQKDGSLIWASLTSIAHSTRSGSPQFINTFHDITERKEAELALDEAQSQIKTLGGLLPICAVCKKIRDDEGYWHQVESYVAEHTEAGFSHGYCPECFEKARQDVANARGPGDTP
jgi:PAS domain S-box-containing protein